MNYWTPFSTSAGMTNASGWSSLVKLTGLAVLFYVGYFIVGKFAFTIRVRKRYGDIPCLPRHWFWGHLILAGERLDPSLPRHPDYAFEVMWEELGRPGAFWIDLAPVEDGLVIIADASIAEQIVQPSSSNKYSVRKSDTVGLLWRLTGKESMITAEGEVWRALRKRFNKGFSPAHLHSLSPLVISKTRIFTERLRAASESDAVFRMKDYAQDLATDIITTIAIEKDFGSQSVPDGEGPKSRFGFLTASRKLAGLSFKAGQGFNLLYILNPVRPAQERFYQKIQNLTLEKLIRESIKTDKMPEQTSGKSIVQLALSGMQPTEALIANTRDQIKTFLFAGQDTTATVIQWICYELWRASYLPKHTSYLEKLKAEHDEVFGPGDFSALPILERPEKAEQILGDKLPYTTAFVKEVLRMRPPAGSARKSPFDPKDEPPLTINIDGKPVRIDGLRMYIADFLIQRDPRVWGPDAHDFNPDRWMDEDYMRKLPTGSWRPFERGPRNCIGQELALMELKIVLCAVARGFKFEKIGMTGRNGEEEVFSTHQVTSIPSDGMVMKVHLSKKDK